MKKHLIPTLTLVLAILGGLLVSTQVLADPPSQSGPIVFRYQAQWGWAYRDDGLLAVHGFDVTWWCALGCPGNPDCFVTDELHNAHDVISPADQDLIIQLWKGDDLTTTVWLAQGNLCESVAATEGVPLASGTVDLVSTDNDFFAGLVHRRHNSYKWSAHGVLETLEGDRVIFNGHASGVWHPEFDQYQWHTQIVMK